ncbi:alpha/beta hydrolase fold domain-containing protein [Phthorimaea operculella]|nr:alpha/beta hydrolase fold domain-containing protein [Phthorimaea operculella]
MFLHTALSEVIIFVTISCYLHVTTSDILSGFSDVANGVTNQGILPELLSGDGIIDTLEDILKAGPSLKESIAELEGTDFLEKYKAGEKNEEKDLPITQLVEKYGYMLETFTVETEDGYLIALYRIPGKGDPVLVVNGITLSSVDWFTVGKESALPCLLADQGYDVWLISNRGTTKESQGHVNFTLPRDADLYWNFSFDELGRYDLPATIDFILKETGKAKLKYVGYSQGTTVFYVMASERPEYSEKISLMVSLASGAWVSHMRSPLFRIVGAVPNTLDLIRNLIGFNEFDADNPLLQLVTDDVCGPSELAVVVCSTSAFALFGFDYAQVNATQAPVMFSHYPSSFSSKQLIHFGQLVQSGKFRRFDYGSDKNVDVYGTKSPPDYPVGKINTPVAIVYSRANDWVSVYEDVLILKNNLPNVVDFYKVPYNTWSHIDYVWAKDVKELVYNRVMELLNKY